MPASFERRFEEGEAVEAQVQGYLFWFPGKIAKKNDPDGTNQTTYAIHFDDGDVDLAVPTTRIRRPKANRSVVQEQRGQIIDFLKKNGSAANSPRASTSKLFAQPDPLKLGRSADQPSAGKKSATINHSKPSLGISNENATRYLKLKAPTQRLAAKSSSTQQSKQHPARKKRALGEGIELLSKPVTDSKRAQALIDMVHPDCSRCVLDLVHALTLLCGLHCQVSENDDTKSSAVQGMMLEMIASCAILACDYDTARHARHAVCCFFANVQVNQTVYSNATSFARRRRRL